MSIGVSLVNYLLIKNLCNLAVNSLIGIIGTVYKDSGCNPLSGSALAATYCRHVYYHCHCDTIHY